MIKDFTDLELGEEDIEETISAKLKEKMGISLDDIKLQLSEAVKENANTIVEDMVNIVPNGDYGNILFEKNDMVNFLRAEAYKPENWLLTSICPEDTKSLIDFVFYCKSVDDGDTFCGHVLVSKSGKIRHAFAQIDE